MKGTRKGSWMNITSTLGCQELQRSHPSILRLTSKFSYMFLQGPKRKPAHVDNGTCPLCIVTHIVSPVKATHLQKKLDTYRRKHLHKSCLNQCARWIRPEVPPRCKIYRSALAYAYGKPPWDDGIPEDRMISMSSTILTWIDTEP